MSEFPRNTERDHEVEEAEADVAEAEAAVESDLSQLTQLEGERADLLDTLRRVQADFENYRKRALREQTSLVERATEGLVEQLLPVIDNFELALANLGDVRLGLGHLTLALGVRRELSHADCSPGSSSTISASATSSSSAAVAPAPPGAPAPASDAFCACCACA